MYNNNMRILGIDPGFRPSSYPQSKFYILESYDTIFVLKM